MHKEYDCTMALLEFADPGLNAQDWLERHVDLYTSLLIWPVGLPPI